MDLEAICPQPGDIFNYLSLCPRLKTVSSHASPHVWLKLDICGHMEQDRHKLHLFSCRSAGKLVPGLLRKARGQVPQEDLREGRVGREQLIQSRVLTGNPSPTQLSPLPRHRHRQNNTKSQKNNIFFLNPQVDNKKNPAKYKPRYMFMIFCPTNPESSSRLALSNSLSLSAFVSVFVFVISSVCSFSIYLLSAFSYSLIGLFISQLMALFSYLFVSLFCCFFLSSFV